jgi:hypothetical protein
VYPLAVDHGRRYDELHAPSLYLRNGQHSALGGPHRPQTERNPVNLIFEDAANGAMLLWGHPHLQCILARTLAGFQAMYISSSTQVTCRHQDTKTPDTMQKEEAHDQHLCL